MTPEQVLNLLLDVLTGTAVDVMVEGERLPVGAVSCRALVLNIQARLRQAKEAVREETLKRHDLLPRG